jgi:hypothetical protein
MKTARVTALLTLVALFGSASVALGQFTQVRRLSETLEANQERLQEQQMVQLFDVRHDADGELQKTPIPLPPEEAPAEPAKKKRKAKKKKQQAAELTADLKQFIDGYIHMSPDRMQQYVMGSKVYHGRGPSGAETQILSRNVVFQGDSMDIIIDGPSGIPKRLEIMTSHAGEPLHLDARFERLDDGTGYPAQAVVKTEVKESKITIVVENFDYEKLDG